MGGMGQRALQPECWEGDESESRLANAVHEVLRASEVQARRAGLAKTLDVEVIPRLVLARRGTPAAERPDEAQRGIGIGADEVERFVRAVLERDMADVVAEVDATRARGVSLEGVFLHLLSPAAQRLGDLWNEDLCDFTQVTMGLWRLQQIIRELSPAFCDLGDVPDPARRALLVPTPGEQHTFGLFMVAEFFRRAGWDVRAGPLDSTADLVDLVRHESFGIVGISVSSDARLDGLAAMILAIRRTSRNRAVGIMVGGPPFVAQPELAVLLGADASAVDARQAALQAERLLALAARRA
jgi:methanogenic corrinoid protein MtbC1